jgi:hypothetical protein
MYDVETDTVEQPARSELLLTWPGLTEKQEDALHRSDRVAMSDHDAGFPFRGKAMRARAFGARGTEAVS